MINEGGVILGDYCEGCGFDLPSCICSARCPICHHVTFHDEGHAEDCDKPRDVLLEER